MNVRNCAAVLPVIGVVAVALAAEPARFLQVRVAEGAQRRCAKILVLGITDDRETRHRFEDRFVTHLRGQEVAAITSYSIVEDLSRPGDRDRILAALEQQAVDAVLTVRAVPAVGSDDGEWAQAWNAWAESPATIRELVAESIPVPKKSAKRYGVEIGFWNLSTGGTPWAARTPVVERKALREAAGDLMQEVIAELKEARLL